MARVNNLTELWFIGYIFCFGHTAATLTGSRKCTGNSVRSFFTSGRGEELVRETLPQKQGRETLGNGTAKEMTRKIIFMSIRILKNDQKDSN